MAFQGKFWLLHDEEPINVDTGRVIEMRDGIVLDGRTGERRGTYTETADGVRATFEEVEGEQEVVQFRPFHAQAGSSETLPFDTEAEGYPLTYSTVKFETYRAANPIPEDEDEDAEAERWEWEEDHFPMIPGYGFAFRDGPRVYEMHRENVEAAKRYLN